MHRYSTSNSHYHCVLRFLAGITAVLLLAALSVPAATAAAKDAQEEFTRKFEKTVTLSAGQGVRIEHRLGSINVRTHAQREVIIQVNMKVSGTPRDEAIRFKDEIQIEMEQTAGGLSIRTEYPQWFEKMFSGRRSLSFSVDYEVTMPENAPLAIQNSFGNVSVVGLKAAAEINNEHGSLTFREGHGNHRLTNRFGSIEVANNTGDLDISNNNSSVTVLQVQGAVSLRNRFGAVSVSQVSQRVTIVNGNGRVELRDAGPANVTNAFGSVSAEGIRGDLFVGNGNGTIDVRNVGGAAELSTTFGSISFSDIRGKLTANPRAKMSTKSF